MCSKHLRSALVYLAAALFIYAPATPASAQLVGALVAGEVDTAPGSQINVSVDNQGRVRVVGAAAGGSVYGPDAPGGAPSAAPLQNGYVDGGGLVRRALGDTAGAGIVAGRGTAGTPTGGILTVQGAASMTPLLSAQSGAWATSITGTLPAFAATPTVNLGTIAGASTAAKQPALGTSGTPSADVLTVQGASGMTPFAVQGAGGALTQASFSVTTSSAQVVASNASRKYLLCQSYSANSGSVYFSVGVSATVGAGSVEVAPGGSMVFEHNFIPTGAVNVISAAGGQAITCIQG